ncbi:DUF3267 domain-containing protein [Fodinibius sediminis]|uniref:Zincin peptidase n=1 Tax=Fodinibius sediminis TaxID=1214077 RepID=A0A521EKV5_9BACT|nr:DUF3267 domain-containing protein [Fodinibius sediminis]SMO84548.1 Putative zincin peptidase [Fodinibius sediminis]
MNNRKIVISNEQISAFAKTFTIYNAIVIGVPFMIIWGSELFDQVKSLVQVFLNDGLLSYIWIFAKIYFFIMIGLFAGMILHELIHALTFILVARKGCRAIKFGYIEKPFIPYVHLREKISIRSYRAGTVMPGLLLGIIPSIAGLWMGSAYLLLFGIVFTGAAAGDFLVLKATKGITPGHKVKDLPDQIGFEVVSPH